MGLNKCEIGEQGGLDPEKKCISSHMREQNYFSRGSRFIEIRETNSCQRKVGPLGRA